MSEDLLIEYLPDTESDFPIPEYQTEGSSGLDLRAYLPKTEQGRGVILSPGERQLISSGFKIEIPIGFEGQIRARSGLSLKYGIALANGIGTIDSDYRGPLGIILINLGPMPFIIKHGQRVAQLVIVSVRRIELKVVKAISKSERNESGYGSTGNF